MFRKLAVVLAAPLLALAACATEADTTQLTAADPVVALRAAPEAVADAGSARFELTVALAGDGHDLTIPVSGAFSGDRVRLQVELGPALAALGNPLGGDVALPAGIDEPMEVVVDGGTAYLRLPLLDALTGASGWLSATPDDLAKAGSFGAGLGGADPTQLLAALRGLSDEVTEVGAEEVRGVPTTHHRATVDLEQALAQMPAEQRSRFEEQLGGGGLDLTEVPVDVWIDGDGLPRRLALDLAGAAEEALGAGGTASLTLELFDYGEAIDIEVPAAGDVTPLGEVLGGLGGLAGMGALDGSAR